MRKKLLKRAEALLSRVEQLLEHPPESPDWDQLAFRWQHRGDGGSLVPVEHPHRVSLDDLLCMDAQKREVERNTRQFIDGQPANNVLLWGSRGTGKSTLVKAIFNAYANRGLRLIEVDKAHLIDLTEIVELIRPRAEKYLIYCDDLSFEAEDASYKSLKAVLEGSISAPADNLLIYATSNRRHLIPEYFSENEQARPVDGEIHQAEAVEEKISLSERFGIWLSFYPFTQEQYLQIVGHWLSRLDAGDVGEETTRLAALRWATQRGSRSGRVARQFAIDWLGR